MFWAGQWGVDLFFILSGFIVYLTTKDHSSWRAFAVKRIFRIYPAYWFCLAVYRLLSAHATSGRQGVSAWIQDVLMLPFAGPIGFNSLTVAQAWSTCYEMYFYFLLALLLAIGVTKKCLLPLIALVFFSTHWINVLHPCSGFSGFVLSIVGRPHVLFFCEGIALAFIHTQVREIRVGRKELAMLVGVVCLTYSFLLIRGYGLGRSFVASPVLFLVVLKANELLPGKGLLNGVWVKLGDISFSLYLIHLLVLGLLKKQCGIHSFIPLLVFTLTGTIAFSLMTYVLIEKPFIAFGRRLAVYFEQKE